MSTNTPNIDRLAEHGVTPYILARGEAYGILRYLGDNIHQFNLGKVQFPTNEHVEKWIQRQGVNNVLEKTKLLRMYSLNDYISDESKLLKSDALEAFSESHKGIDFNESEQNREIVSKRSITEMFDRYNLDKLVNSISSEEDIREYAREYGRILAGEDIRDQKFHVATGTGRNITPLAVQHENEEAKQTETVSSERQSIREMIKSLTSLPNNAMELQTEME